MTVPLALVRQVTLATLPRASVIEPRTVKPLLFSFTEYDLTDVVSKRRHVLRSHTNSRHSPSLRCRPFQQGFPVPQGIRGTNDDGEYHEITDR